MKIDQGCPACGEGYTAAPEVHRATAVEGQRRFTVGVVVVIDHTPTTRSRCIWASDVAAAREYQRRGGDQEKD